ncbi:conserved hypothetical protein [Burkholderia pseudomallei 668]|nr:conserved hypothetical protein [Burkholderia pseudomallei 668]
MKLVEPGKPDVSYGLHKLKGSQASVGGKGGAMPFGEPCAARGARTRRRARTMDRKRRAEQLTERTVGGRDREGGRAVAVGCAPPPSVAMDRDRLRSVTIDRDRSLSCGRLRLGHSSGAVRS